MKRSFLGIIFLMVTVLFTACNTAQNIDPNQAAATTANVGNTNAIDPSQLPAAVKTAITQDFAGQTVTQASKTTGSDDTHMYNVTMSNQAKASYNKTGQRCTTLDIAQLPQAITDYVAKNYAGTSIVEAIQVPNIAGNTYTLVVLSTDQVLTFDAANNFLGTLDGDDLDDDDDDDHCIEDSIAVSALPQAVRDYVVANYAGQTITEAYKKTLQDGSILYLTELSNGVELIFDANGKFIEEHKDDDDNDGTSQNITVTDLPQAAQDYLKTNYANNTVVEAEKETSATGVVSYEVELNDGTEVVFDATGNFVKAEKDD